MNLKFENEIDKMKEIEMQLKCKEQEIENLNMLVTKQNETIKLLKGELEIFVRAIEDIRNMASRRY